MVAAEAFPGHRTCNVERRSLCLMAIKHAKSAACSAVLPNRKQSSTGNFPFVCMWRRHQVMLRFAACLFHVVRQASHRTMPRGTVIFGTCLALAQG